jgi:hypothetical protein
MDSLITAAGRALAAVLFGVLKQVALGDDASALQGIWPH